MTLGEAAGRGARNEGPLAGRRRGAPPLRVPLPSFRGREQTWATAAFDPLRTLPDLRFALTSLTVLDDGDAAEVQPTS